MHHTRNRVEILAVISIVLWSCCSGIPSIKEWYLDKHCRIPLKFPCPTGNEASGAARLTFRQIPQGNCSIQIALPPRCRVMLALYLNFQIVQLANTQMMEVFDTTNNTRRLAKRLMGRVSKSQTKGISSVAHYLSAFHHSPSVIISFENRGPPVQQRSDKVVIDLTTVSRDPSGDLIQCEQLGGYVPETLCHRGSNRITCPVVYSARLGFDLMEQLKPCDK